MAELTTPPSALSDARDLRSRFLAALSTDPGPGSGGSAESSEAAVLGLFRVRQGASEVLLMRRIEREGDPWSGQISFPGGRRQPSDRELSVTVLREAHEEVGLEPRHLEGAPLLFRVLAPSNRPQLKVGVFLGVAMDPPHHELRAGPEAASIAWVPYRGLRPAQRDVHPAGAPERFRVEGLAYGDLFVWGFTRRILQEIEAVIGPNLP